MKILIPIVIGLLVVGCGGSKEKEEKATAEDKAGAWVADPNDSNNVKIENAIRKQLKKPTGELTKAKVTKLDLERTQITAAGLKEVAKRVLLEAARL